MLIHGLSEQKLQEFADNSFDALITDPPAGISFMSKQWDKDKGGRDMWIAWMQSVMQEVLRVLKPGAHGLVWALPRTSHWTATALENAGFEIRDSIVHIFGSGFPKSTDVSKQIDKMKGAKRDVLGKNVYRNAPTSHSSHSIMMGEKTDDGKLKREWDITDPATDEAKEWQGYGTALKPAHENWVLVRKPLSEKTVARNVLTHGTGALNIDASRIPTEENRDRQGGNVERNSYKIIPAIFTEGHSQGRFPANLLLSHHPECKETCAKECAVKGLDDHSGQLSQCGSPKKTTHDKGMFGIGTPGKIFKEDDRGASRFFYQCHPDCAVKGLDDHTEDYGRSAGGSDSKSINNETNMFGTNARSIQGINNYNDKGSVSRFFYQCHPDCAVKGLDDHSGILSSDSPNRTPRGNVATNGVVDFGTSQNEKPNRSDIGGASRFFYCAKASRKDRGEDNIHPTVKSTKLMEYLIRLITPPNGRILDPFAGSGSTLVAAKRLGFDFVGIEQDPDYCKIAFERIENVI